MTGFYTIDAAVTGRFSVMWEAFRYLVLPVFTLGLVLAAPILKMVRVSMIESLESDYVRTARAIGVSRRVDLVRRRLPERVLIPITTMIGIVFGFMLGGNIIVEFLFSWPGVGRYAFKAISTRDLERTPGFRDHGGHLVRRAQHRDRHCLRKDRSQNSTRRHGVEMTTSPARVVARLRRNRVPLAREVDDAWPCGPADPREAAPGDGGYIAGGFRRSRNLRPVLCRRSLEDQPVRGIPRSVGRPLVRHRQLRPRRVRTIGSRRPSRSDHWGGHRR